MQQAVITPPGAPTAEERRAELRELFTGAASSPEAAVVLGALADLFVGLKRAHAESAGTRSCLVALARRDGLRPSELAAALDLDQSTVSRHLAHLQAQGFLIRTPDPQDRRAHRLALTEDGMGEVRRVIAERAQLLESGLAGWPSEQVAALGQLLSQFVTGLQHVTDLQQQEQFA